MELSDVLPRCQHHCFQQTPAGTRINKRIYTVHISYIILYSSSVLADDVENVPKRFFFKFAEPCVLNTVYS